MAPAGRRTAYVTTSGTKYATRRSRADAPGANRAPPTAFCRGYLRAGLPGIYQDGGFGVDFVEALEKVIDPIVATLDSLSAYFNPELAPEDVLELVAAWLGMELDEAAPLGSSRVLVRTAGDLARRRGTKRGLELLLEAAFPDLPLRVEDRGEATWATDPDAPARAQPAEFVVSCDVALGDVRRAAVARAIELAKSVHVNYRLQTAGTQ